MNILKKEKIKNKFKLKILKKNKINKKENTKSKNKI
tara:strand:+ start:184 stop:291 length:108 start_codon:yes stop_codon:yes gene_type:complete